MTIIGKVKTFWLRLYSKFYYLQVVFAALSSCIISNYFAYNFRMKRDFLRRGKENLNQ